MSGTTVSNPANHPRLLPRASALLVAVLVFAFVFAFAFAFARESIPTSTTLQTSSSSSSALDCGMRSLALDAARKILSDNNNNNHNNHNNANDTDDVLSAVRDALQFSRLCPDPRFRSPSSPPGKPSATTTTRDESNTNTNDDNSNKDRGGENPRRDEGTTIVDGVCRQEHVTCIFVAPSESAVGSSSSSSSSSHPQQRNQQQQQQQQQQRKQQQAMGSRHRPWTCLHRALEHARSLEPPAEENGYGYGHGRPTEIVLWLQAGIHYLKGRPLALSERDNGLSIRGIQGGGAAWISGGIPLRGAVFRPDTSTATTAAGTTAAAAQGVYVADLTALLEGHDLPKTPSLFGTNKRYVRARYPDGDPEVDAWGYQSPGRLEHSLSSSSVLDWTMPPPGDPPDFVLVDFANNPPEGVPTKDDSTMDGYNTYASGSGGACGAIWGPNADSYWCSNASDGGWAEVDRECAISGRMQIPAGMAYNRSDPALGPLSSTSTSTSISTSLEGGTIFAWHSQSWAMHMFEIEEHSPKDGTMTFAEGGGKQGGRNWCRCDQCTYAGPWCGQHQTPPDPNDRRLIGGNWMIENVKGFLDQPGEYYFDPATLHLYVKPNTTEELQDLTLAVLTELVGMRNNATNIRLEGVSFRDQAATYLEDGWSAPSGGDWSLRRGGAVFVEHASNVTIRGCRFFRLDGTAVFLSRRTRHVSIVNNRFEWLGENAIATWGDTDGYDATAGEFPMHTLVEGNVMRELGIYEKQSSAVGICKAALTTVRNNIVFNTARAAINFNDMVGGGDVVEGNLLFNTCRESGDHGPINSWDRQAYLTTLKDGTTPSFDPIPRVIRRNLIFANYGASQGVDNDDGSSWFHIHYNVFYDADGFKMDYGGHDSVYEHNMAISFSYRGGPCFGMGSFKEGHGDVLRGNRCLVGVGNSKDTVDGTNDESIYEKARLDALYEHYGYSRPETRDDEPTFVGRLWGGCEDSHVTLESNEYYTPDGIARVGCNGDQFYTLSELESNFGLEVNSTVAPLPDVDTVLEWARSTLGMAAAAAAAATASVTGDGTSLS